MDVEVIKPKYSIDVLSINTGTIYRIDPPSYSFSLPADGYLTVSGFSTYTSFVIYNSNSVGVVSGGNTTFYSPKLKKGDYKIKVFYNGTGDSDSGKSILIKEYIDQPLLSSSVKLDQVSVTRPVGDSFILQATVEPSNTTDTLVWNSSNPKVATVDANGTVKTLALGTTVITASCGIQKATCTVNVKAPLKTVSLYSTTKIARDYNTDIFPITVPAEGKVTVEISSQSQYLLGNLVLKDQGGMEVLSGRFLNTSKNSPVKHSAYLDAGLYSLEITRDNGKEYFLNVSLDIFKEYPIETMSINKTSLSLIVGNKERLSFSYKPSHATNTKGVWKSNNPAIAKVDQDGNVTGVSQGTTTVTVSCGSVSASCNVTVTTIPITKIWIETKGNACEMKYSPSNTSDLIDPVWSSSNNKIATIDKNGRITPKRLGTTTITVKNGNLKATKEYIVTQDTKEYELFLGEKLNLRSRLKFVDGYKDAVWSCSKNAKVSQDGVVKMISGGKATISATVKGKKYNLFVFADTVAVGGYYDPPLPKWGWGTYYFTFSNADVASLDKDKEYITGVSMGKTSYTITKDSHKETRKISVNSVKKELEIAIGGTEALSEYLTNIEKYKSATWKSSKKSVATVNKNGIVSAVAEGSAKIVATINDVKYTIHVQVVQPKLNYSVYHFHIGDTAKLKLKNTGNAKVTWNSSDSSVVTVNSSGKITGKRAGYASVTATVNGKKYSCAIRVDKKVYGIVRGTVTYYFNSNFGYRPDTNAEIVAIDWYTKNIVARALADGSGNYSMRVPIGEYVITINSSGRYPKGKSRPLEVKEGEEYVFNASFGAY